MLGNFISNYGHSDDYIFFFFSWKVDKPSTYPFSSEFSHLKIIIIIIIIIIIL